MTSIYSYEIILVLSLWISKQDYKKSIQLLETGASRKVWIRVWLRLTTDIVFTKQIHAISRKVNLPSLQINAHTFANSVDPNEKVRHEPSHQDLTVSVLFPIFDLKPICNNRYVDIQRSLSPFQKLRGERDSQQKQRNILSCLFYHMLCQKSGSRFMPPFLWTQDNRTHMASHMAAVKRLPILHHSADYIFDWAHSGFFENWTPRLRMVLRSVCSLANYILLANMLRLNEIESRIFVLLYVLCFQRQPLRFLIYIPEN